MTLLQMVRKPFRVARLALWPGKRAIEREFETGAELINPKEADLRIVVPESLPEEQPDEPADGA